MHGVGLHFKPTVDIQPQILLTISIEPDSTVPNTLQFEGQAFEFHQHFDQIKALSN